MLVADALASVAVAVALASVAESVGSAVPSVPVAVAVAYQWGPQFHQCLWRPGRR